MAKKQARESNEKPFYGSQELPRIPLGGSGLGALNTGKPRPASDDSD